VWLLSTALSLTAAVHLGAQSSIIALERVTPGPVSGTAGSTVTAVIRVTNKGSALVNLKPNIDTPSGWGVVLGNTEFPLAGGASDIWMMSVGVPARASAGSYTIRFGLGAESKSPFRDSVLVVLKERRAVEIKLSNRPSYVIAGSAYTVEYLVRNKGNSTAAIAIDTKSGLARKITVTPATVTLAPGESRSLKVSVQMRKVGLRATEDVLEVTAAHALDRSATSHVSSTITVVQPAGYTEPRVIVPSVLKIRGTPDGETASPFEFSGGGPLRSTGDVNISYLARGKTGQSSAFGDREEYWLDLTSPRYSLRGGDNLYRLSPLLGGGQPGFGGALEANAHGFNLGGYAQRFRFQDGTPSERGASVGWKDSTRAQFALNAIDRPNGSLAGRVAGLSGQVNPFSDMSVEFDFGRNLGGGRSGFARSIHLNGRAPLQYDIGHVYGDSNFNGPARGITHSYGVLSGKPFGNLRVNVSGSDHKVMAAPYVPESPELAFRDDSFRTAGAGIAWNDWLSLDYLNTQQQQGTIVEPVDEQEQSLALRITRSFSFTNFFVSAEAGRVERGVDPKQPHYTMYSAGSSFSWGAQSFSFFGDLYSGGSINRGPVPFVSLGGEANVRVTSLLRVSVTAFSSRTRDGSPGGYSQVDSRVTQSFASGSSISIRMRRSAAGMSAARTVGYIEYSLPIGIPSFHAAVRGRATGRVVDAETGKGLVNALVRLGPQAAITDRDGRVYFSSLPQGEYRASLAQETTSSDKIFIGNPEVTIDTLNLEPVTFHLAVDRPATVKGTLREWVLAKKGIGNEADSLREENFVEGATVALMSATDTLYRLTDFSGGFLFQEIPKGEWAIKVVTDPPPGKRFDPVETKLQLRSGGAADVLLRLIPQQRTIRMIGGDVTSLVSPDPTPPVRR
jgi:hypothetical protein